MNNARPEDQKHYRIMRDDLKATYGFAYAQESPTLPHMGSQAYWAFHDCYNLATKITLDYHPSAPDFDTELGMTVGGGYHFIKSRYAMHGIYAAHLDALESGDQIVADGSVQMLQHLAKRFFPQNYDPLFVQKVTNSILTTTEPDQNTVGLGTVINSYSASGGAPTDTVIRFYENMPPSAAKNDMLLDLKAQIATARVQKAADYGHYDTVEKLLSHLTDLDEKLAPLMTAAKLTCNS